MLSSKNRRDQRSLTHRLWTASRVVIVACLATLSSLLTAGVLAQIKDVTGSKDPAGIKRYEGSIVIGYSYSKFDEFTFATGPLKPSNQASGPSLAPATTERADGQRWRIVYVAPEGRSPLEVLRNYEQELAKSGFKTMYQCARVECGPGGDVGLGERYLYTMSNRLSDTPPSGSGRPPGQISEYAYSSGKDQRYLFAKRTGGPATPGRQCTSRRAGMDMHKETFGHTIVLLDLVETAAMETKMVTVNASSMAKDIAATGHVALYGILFDTDKTDIKPESAATIAEIAKFLKQEPKVTLFVVGHTDNVGGYDHNMGLSQRRAASVVQELTAKHGVAAARLKPAGTGHWRRWRQMRPTKDARRIGVLSW